MVNRRNADKYENSLVEIKTINSFLSIVLTERSALAMVLCQIANKDRGYYLVRFTSEIETIINHINVVR